MNRIQCALNCHGVDRRLFRAARLAATLLLVGRGIATQSVSAATLPFAGTSSHSHPTSGSTDYTVNGAANTVTIQLTNSTTTTLDAGELFTGLDFMVGGLTPTMASNADTGIERTVDGGGAFTDTGSAQNLSWSLLSL